jgi:hypothetical protein
MSVQVEGKKVLSLKAEFTFSEQLKKEAEAMGINLSAYLNLLIEKGRTHQNDDYRNLQLKKMNNELDILKRLSAEIVKTLKIIVDDFGKREAITRKMIYEIMKADFETRSLSRKITDATFTNGEEVVLKTIDDHFKNKLYLNWLKREKIFY